MLIGFTIGFFIGGVFGVFTMAILSVRKEDEDD